MIIFQFFSNMNSNLQDDQYPWFNAQNFPCFMDFSSRTKPSWFPHVWRWNQQKLAAKSTMFSHDFHREFPIDDRDPRGLRLRTPLQSGGDERRLGSRGRGAERHHFACEHHPRKWLSIVKKLTVCYWKWQFMAIYSGFTRKIWWFSIVMLVYQRISIVKYSEDMMISKTKNHWMIHIFRGNC